MHPHPELVRGRPGAGKERRLDDVRVRQDARRPVPPVADDLGGTGREGDELIRGRDEDVQGGLVGRGIGLMGIAQVVHRVDEGLAVPSQDVHEGGQLGGTLRVEPEVQVEDVEVLVVGAHPVGVEHDRRPPALRRAGCAVGPGSARRVTPSPSCAEQCRTYTWPAGTEATRMEPADPAEGGCSATVTSSGCRAGSGSGSLRLPWFLQHRRMPQMERGAPGSQRVRTVAPTGGERRRAGSGRSARRRVSRRRADSLKTCGGHHGGLGRMRKLHPGPTYIHATRVSLPSH